MRNRILLRVLLIAALAAVFAAGLFSLCGIRSDEDDPADDNAVEMIAMPDFKDVTETERAYLEIVYGYGLMSGISEDIFGLNENMTASETAYTAIRLFEYANDIPSSGSGYDRSEDYTSQAAELGIWPVEKTGSDIVTRMDAAAVYSRFVEWEPEAEGSITEFLGMEEFGFPAEMMTMYNRNIMLDQSIKLAYSPYIGLTRGEAARLLAMIVEPYFRVTKHAPDYAGLRNDLSGALGGYEGDWSLYFEDYNSGEVISINSHKIYSASLIKLFVIQTVYQSVYNGTMKDTPELEELLRRMITFSDNDAWSELARRLGNGSYTEGMRRVTQTAAASGFADTGQFFEGDHKNFNFTSVNDCGIYLHSVLSGELVSPEYSEKILNYLKQQQVRIKIPAGVPDGVTVANKTGELEYMQGDAAVVFAPSGPYILVIAADDLVNTGTAQQHIAELSAEIYNYLERGLT